jgi:hypothetical protein
MDARDSSTITIRNSTFTGFRAMQGGAIMVQVEATLMLNGSRLISNEAVKGGAVAIKGSSANAQVIVDSSLIGNSAEAGGALWIDSSVSALVSGCFFQQNKAQMYGGAIQNSGATALTIQGTRFVENSNVGGAGGAISLERGAVATTIVWCQFSRNTASKGGAVSSNLAPVRIAHSAFEANAARKLDDDAASCLLSGSNGGALLLTPARLVLVGSMPLCMPDQVLLHNLTFRSNAATDQGGSASRTRVRALRPMPCAEPCISSLRRCYPVRLRQGANRVVLRSRAALRLAGRALPELLVRCERRQRRTNHLVASQGSNLAERVGGHRHP